MPRCSSRGSGWLALPQELGRSLESQGSQDGTGQAVQDRPPNSATGKIIAHAAARRMFRNGLPID